MDQNLDDGKGRKHLIHMVQAGELKAVLFDLDGTLIHSGVAFSPYRERLDIQGDVIQGIMKLPPVQQKEKWDIIQEYEQELQRRSKPALGAMKLLAYLKETGVKTAVITRSTGSHARALIMQHSLDIALAIGRDDITPKPDPKGIFYLLDKLGIEKEHAIMVGDFLWDMLAGKNAGIPTVMVLQDHSKPYAAMADVVVGSLSELDELLRPVH